MGAGSVIAAGMFFLIALIMIGNGIFQYRSESPVAFYSGEKPPAEEELTDVTAWNQKHGMMWLLCGIAIILSGVAGVLIAEKIWSTAVMCFGVLVPIRTMIWYHELLVSRYKIDGEL